MAICRNCNAKTAAKPKKNRTAILANLGNYLERTDA